MRASRREGWGARLLALQGDDGQWAGGACFPAEGWRRADDEGQPWISTLPTLDLLCAFGLDRARRSRAAGADDGERWLPVGARRSAVLQRRGRAVHQRQDRHAGRLVRARHGERGRPPARRAARGRRVELRGGERVRPIVVPHDDQRPRKVFWRTSAPPAAPRHRSRRGAAARNTCSNGSYSGVRAPATSSTRPGCSSRFRRAGTMTCCGLSITSDRPATRRTRGWPKRSSAPFQTADRWHVAARKYASWQSSLRARGRRWPAQSVEHAAGAACPRHASRAEVHGHVLIAALLGLFGAFLEIQGQPRLLGSKGVELADFCSCQCRLLLSFKPGLTENSAILS